MRNTVTENMFPRKPGGPGELPPESLLTERDNRPR